jgi:hypothetical protein
MSDHTPDHIGLIGISDVVENDDGSAHYTFEMDDETAKQMTSLGLELALHCGAYRVDIQDVFNWIKEQTNEGN